jgi:hypothetical protein
MAWWVQLILALAQALPSVIEWIKNHPKDPKGAMEELKTMMKG